MPPNEWKNKGVGYLRPGYKRSSETKPVIDERDGSKAGAHREHWDGRQDARANPGTVRMKFSQGEER